MNPAIAVQIRAGPSLPLARKIFVRWFPAGFSSFSRLPADFLVVFHASVQVSNNFLRAPRGFPLVSCRFPFLGVAHACPLLRFRASFTVYRGQVSTAQVSKLFAACRVSKFPTSMFPASFHSFAASLTELRTGFLRAFPSQGVSRVSFGFLRKFPHCKFSKFSMGHLRASCGFPAGFLLVSCGFLQISCGVPAGFRVFPAGFQNSTQASTVCRGFPSVSTLVCSGFPRSFSGFVAGLTQSGFPGLGLASAPRVFCKGREIWQPSLGSAALYNTFNLLASLTRLSPSPSFKPLAQYDTEGIRVRSLFAQLSGLLFKPLSARPRHGKILEGTLLGFALLARPL